jgi:hypothetical protein
MKLWIKGYSEADSQGPSYRRGPDEGKEIDSGIGQNWFCFLLGAYCNRSARAGKKITGKHPYTRFAGKVFSQSSRLS